MSKFDTTKPPSGSRFPVKLIGGLVAIIIGIFVISEIATQDGGARAKSYAISEVISNIDTLDKTNVKITGIVTSKIAYRGYGVYKLKQDGRKIRIFTGAGLPIIGETYTVRGSVRKLIEINTFQIPVIDEISRKRHPS